MRNEGHRIKGAIRSQHAAGSLPSEIQPAPVGSISLYTDWSAALEGIDTVIHLASRVHMMPESGSDALKLNREINVEATRKLALAAAEHKIKRLVYVSTVKVNGEETQDQPFTEKDMPRPQDPYAISKWEAEQELRTISEKTGLECVIMRPPLIYGPGVKANFLSLLKAVKRGFPLPLAGIKNRRSFIYLGNLVDAILLSMNHEQAPGGIFLVSDGRDMSTPDLIRIIALAMGKKPFLFPVPSHALKGLGLLTRKRGEVKRLISSLFVDSSKISNTLGWTPPFTVEEGIRHTVEWFVSCEENN
jgi:nucleoside-diphosphate-sugar epimerase